MDIYAIGSQFVNEIAVVGKKLYNRGFSNVLSDWATKGEGLERVTRVFVWSLSVVESNKKLVTVEAERVLNNARSFLYTLLFFRSLAQLTGQKGYPKLSYYNITSTFLMAVGAACEAVHFTLRTELLQTTLFNKWSSELGKYSALQLPVLSHLKTRPSLFFLFLSSFASSVENIAIHYKNDLPLSCYFHAHNVLLHIGNGGKMLLIFFNQFPHSHHYFKIVDGMVQIADLILYSMRA